MQQVINTKSYSSPYNASPSSSSKFFQALSGLPNRRVCQCKMRWSGKCALGDHLHFRAQPKYYEMLAKIARRFLHSWSFVGHPSPLVRRQRKFRWNSQLGLSYHQEVKFSLVVMSYVSCNLRITGKIRDNSRLSVFVVWQIYQMSVVLNKLLLFRLNLISVSKNSWFLF